MGIRLAVADGHTLCRHGVARIVEDQADIEIVAEAATAAEMLALARGPARATDRGPGRGGDRDADRGLDLRAGPGSDRGAGSGAAGLGVAMIAAVLPDGDGVALARALRERDPRLGIVVMAAAEHDDLLFRAMDAQASAYVAKSAPATEMLAAIRHAAVAPQSFTASGLARALGRRRTGELLSPREREVLALLMDGLSIATIASTMHLSHSTAKTYTARLYEKLGAANRTQALRAALRLGLIREDQWGVESRRPAV